MTTNQRLKLKAKGKELVRRDYLTWLIVGIFLIVDGFRTTFEARDSYNSGDITGSFSTSTTSNNIGIATITVLIGGAMIGLLVLAITAIIRYSITVSLKQLAIEGLKGKQVSRMDTLIYGFKESLGRNVLSLFLTDLYTVLWTFLLIIPGIIKGYSYSAVPYILVKDKTISATDAISLSQRVMDGHKWEYFVLQFTFIGWYILTMIPLVGLWVYPYTEATYTSYFNDLLEVYYPSDSGSSYSATDIDDQDDDEDSFSIYSDF